jgi:alpha-D-ribose 1-methylphosphonate 5-triphosphate synthase subunit PhnH
MDLNTRQMDREKMRTDWNTSTFLPGFQDPVSCSRDVFRSILDAMTHPGKVHSLKMEIEGPAPLHPATAAVCLTLIDYGSSLWTDLSGEGEALKWILFQCGCPLVLSPSAANFALVSGEVRAPFLGQFHMGDEESPERSATVIIQVESLTAGRARALQAKGILTSERLRVKGLPDEFWQEWSTNRRLYPCGVDLILTSGKNLVALPRTAGVGDEKYM